MKKTLRKMRKTPQYLKQRYQPKGRQVGIHQEKSRKNQRVLFGVLSLNPLGSIAKQLAFDDGGGGAGGSSSSSSSKT